MKISPSAQLAGGGVAGALTGIMLWLLNTFGHVTVPDDVAAWIATVVFFLVAIFWPGAPGASNGRAKPST